MNKLENNILILKIWSVRDKIMTDDSKKPFVHK